MAGGWDLWGLRRCSRGFCWFPGLLPPQTQTGRLCSIPLHIKVRVLTALSFFFLQAQDIGGRMCVLYANTRGGPRPPHAGGNVAKIMGNKINRLQEYASYYL